MINLGLARISSLLQPLLNTHTQLPWRAIHIAGTNGKGSIASYISTFLSHQGYRVGRFTSPHLVHRWDCISLNQRTVDRDVFLAVEREVQNRSRDEGIDASEFEVLTAVAFELFSRHGMDFGVVECGLGGRLDATNVLRDGDVVVSVLAKVGLDHVEFLGDTVEKVAGEKVGIFKPGVSVVVDESNESIVLDVVRRELDDINDGDGRKLFTRLPSELETSLDAPEVQALGLAGHQKQNLRTAFTAYYAAELRTGDSAETDVRSQTAEQRINSTSNNLAELIRQSHSSIRGRLEYLALPDHLLPPGLLHGEQKHVKVLIDGAHNPQSANALAAYISSEIRQSSTRPVIWVLAMKQGKEISTIIRTLIAPGDHVITCSFGPVDGMPWVQSLDAKELADQVRTVLEGQVDVEVASVDKGDVTSAIRRAVEVSISNRDKDAENQPICIAGSLYLVGDVFRSLEHGSK